MDKEMLAAIKAEYELVSDAELASRLNKFVDELMLLSNNNENRQSRAAARARFHINAIQFEQNTRRGAVARTEPHALTANLFELARVKNMRKNKAR